MEIIVDTNVFIDALFHGDKDCLTVLYRENKGELTFVMSHSMTEELVKTIFCHAVKLGCTLEEFEQPFLKLSRALRRAKPHEPTTRGNWCEDPGDNKFIECAIDANVEYIVSSDGHLLRIEQEIRNKKRIPLKIVSPYDFIKFHNLFRLKTHFESGN